MPVEGERNVFRKKKKRYPVLLGHAGNSSVWTVPEILRKSQMKYAPYYAKNALIVQKHEQHFKNFSSDMLLGLQAIMQ
jgi:hypothetical protein